MTLEIPLFAVVWREEKLIVFLEKVTRGTTNMNTWTNLLPPLINSCCITGTERPKAAVKKKKKSIQVRVTIGIMSWHYNIWISVGYMILIKLYMKLYIPEPHNLRTLLHYAIKLWNLRIKWSSLYNEVVLVINLLLQILLLTSLETNCFLPLSFVMGLYPTMSCVNFLLLLFPDSGSV